MLWCKYWAPICITCCGPRNNVVLYCLGGDKVWTKVSRREIRDGGQTWRWWRWGQRLNRCFHPLLLSLLLTLVGQRAYLLTLLLTLLRLKHCKGVVGTADTRDKEGLEADGSAQLNQVGEQKGTILDKICITQLSSSVTVVD